MSATRSKRVGTMRTMRERKVHCSACGYNIRTTRKWIAIGLPACPNPDCVCYGQAMACDDPADAVELGYLSLDELPRPVRTEICRRNGWEDEIVRTGPGRRSKPRNCAEPGCGSFVKRFETHCSKHQAADMPF